MAGSETCVNWRITSSNSSPKQRSGDRRTRFSPSWHTASFRAVHDTPLRTSSSASTSAREQRRSSKQVGGLEGKQRHRTPPVPCIAKKDPCSVRCACCCLPDFNAGNTCCRCGRRRQNAEQTTQESQSCAPPPQQPGPPSPPPSPPSPHQEKEDPQPPPPPQPQEQHCPCLHFLGGSPYYPAPEPNTWQFVYWPPGLPRSARKPLPLRPPHVTQRRQSITSPQPKPSEGLTKSSRVNDAPPKKNSKSLPKSAPPSNGQSQPESFAEQGVSYCKGGWRCQCSKYELPESCILAPLPATNAPHVETTVLVPTSTRVIIPAAAPGLPRRVFRVCMPPSELPMCHCPPDCPCPHPRCPGETKSYQPVDPCAQIYHPRSEDDPEDVGCPSVLFGRDPLVNNNG